jgi:hypothetical protein
VFARSKTSGWHRHDLRRTSSTVAGNLGFAPHITETMLGHKNIHSSLAATYNLAKYAPEHLAALQAVADHLEKLCAKKAVKDRFCDFGFGRVAKFKHQAMSKTLFELKSNGIFNFRAAENEIFLTCVERP